MTREERKEYNYWLTRRLNINNIIEKKCTVCKEWKEENIENYYFINKSKLELGLTPACRICTSLKTQKWQVNNDSTYRKAIKRRDANETKERKQAKRKTSKKQRLAGKQKEWQRNNPEKIKQYTLNHRHHDITEKEWREDLKEFNYSCAYCGMTEEEHKRKTNQVLHKDHVDHNGYNDLRNAVPSCGSCNYKKWAFPMEEWYREQEFFSEERLQHINEWITEGYKEYMEEKPPYKITRKQNEDKKTFHWELWSVDEYRNMIKCLKIADKKKELIIP